MACPAGSDGSLATFGIAYLPLENLGATEPLPSHRQKGPGMGNRYDAEGALGIVIAAAARADIPKLAPHDLRCTCARLCHVAGGELDQIQFLLGHVSIQTTEQYLGCKQKLRYAVNDKMGIEP